MHITDGCAIIIDPLADGIRKHLISNDVARQMIDLFAPTDIYFKFDTADAWYVDKTIDLDRVDLIWSTHTSMPDDHMEEKRVPSQTQSMTNLRFSPPQKN